MGDKRDVSSSAWLCSPLHTDLQEYVSSKNCTIRIALKAYKANQMGDATTQPCCYSFTYDTSRTSAYY
jgi:hypothetical protein